MIRNILHNQHAKTSMACMWVLNKQQHLKILSAAQLRGFKSVQLLQPNLLICFGSQTGTAQMFAEGLQSELLQSTETTSYLKSVKVVDLSDIDPEKTLQFANVKNNGVVLFILSNYGEGQPTDNAKTFYDWLMSDKSKELVKGGSEGGPLCALFGCGNSANFPERYQAVGKNVEKRLKEIGCDLIFKRGEGDDGGSEGIETDFETWKNEFLTFLKEQHELALKSGGETAAMGAACEAPPKKDSTVEPSTTDDNVTTNGKYFFRLLDYEQVKDKLRETIREYDPSSPVSPKNPFPLRIESVENLCPKSNRKRLQIEFNIDGTPITYETGDHISIFPTTPDELIRRLEKRLNLSQPIEKMVFTLDSPPCSIESPPFVSTCDKPVSLYQALSQFYDLNGVITPSMLSFLADRTTNENDKNALNKMKGEEYATVKNNFLNIVDILEQFPSVNIQWQDLIGFLPKIQPRYYSISSSKLENEERVKRGESRILRVTYSPLIMVNPKKTFFGLCSNYLSRQGVNDKCQSVVRNSSFRLPKDPMTPIIMAAGGTGIAPFRAFIEERRIMKQKNPSIKFGKSVLFYGVRDENEIIYKDLIYQALNEGLISDVHIAFSGTDKKMIADAIWEYKDEVYQALKQNGGSIYMCGGVSGFGTSIYDQIKRVIKAVDGVDDNGANSFIDSLRKQDRCFEDLSD